MIEVHAKKQFKCSFCDFGCQRLYFLNAHVKQNHLQEKSPKQNDKNRRTQIDITDYAKAMHNIYNEAQALTYMNGEKKRGRPRGAFGKKKKEMFDNLNYLSYYKEKFDKNVIIDNEFKQEPDQYKEINSDTLQV